MSLSFLTQLNAIPAARWDALLPDDGPFLRHAFLSTLEESGCLGEETGWQPEHLLWLEEGKICAALPGYRKFHSRGEYVFDHAWADACQRAGLPYYPKWLSAVPFSPVTGARLLGDASAAEKLLQHIPTFLEKIGCAADTSTSVMHKLRRCWQKIPAGFTALAVSITGRIPGIGTSRIFLIR